MFSSKSGLQDAPELIPAGSLTKAVINVREVKTSQRTGASYLDIELTCVDSPWEGRKVFDMIMDPFDANASDVGRKMGILAITRIGEAIGMFKPGNEESYGRYNADGCSIADVIEDINGQTVAIKLKVEKGTDGHADKNKVGEWLTPNPDSQSGHKGWVALSEGKHSLMPGAAAAARPAFGATAAPVGSATGAGPAWLKKP